MSAAFPAEVKPAVLEATTFTFDPNDLITSSTSITFDNLFMDDILLNSVVNGVADQHIITKFDKVVCLKDPNKLLQLLSTKAKQQQEMFLAILLGGLGDEETKVSRHLMREEFAKLLLTQITRNGRRNESQLIRTIHAYHSVFSKTLVDILKTSESKLTDHIDYSNLEATGKDGILS